MPPGYITVDQLLAIVGATLQAVTGALVVLMSMSEWGRTRRAAYKYLGWAFSLAVLQHVASALAQSWEGSPLVRLSLPVWLHFLEGCFLVLLTYAIAVHERSRTQELKRVSRRLFEINLLLALVLQLLWHNAGRADASLTFPGYWGHQLYMVWELFLLGVGTYLTTVLRPDIRVGPALILLGLGKSLALANLHFWDSQIIWLSMGEWAAGAVASVILLVAAHFGIVTETFTDSLTRLYNRRYFMNRMPQEWDRAHRRGTSIVILVMDLDHFKRYNDTAGHVAGDALLRGVARVLNRQLRPYDLLCRWGGEEFIALLPDTDAEHGVLIAERLRQAVSDSYGQTGKRAPVTISIGVAAWPETEGDWRDVIQGADAALYRAKERRNRVCLHVP